MFLAPDSPRVVPLPSGVRPQVSLRRSIARRGILHRPHFLTKTLARVSTEMSLHVLAYNLKRLMRILGIGATLAMMRV
ncbi:MAG: hypothetical protein H0V78_14160 [Burkholderiales bacterium]|nr:hypothetical protein [Burkholderiales bacterium]